MFLVLARIERPVRGDPVDGDQGAVQHDVGPACSLRFTDRLAEFRCPGREQGRGLLHVSPGRRGADLEAGRQVGERLAFPQVDQDEKGLLARVELAPARPVDLRYRRMIPDTKVRVLRDNGSAAR